MAKKTDKLVVTNYDNFKNAEFFKKQYLQAQEMIKEVNDFYKSFCMSITNLLSHSLRYNSEGFELDLVRNKFFRMKLGKSSEVLMIFIIERKIICRNS